MCPCDRSWPPPSPRCCAVSGMTGWFGSAAGRIAWPSHTRNTAHSWSGRWSEGRGDFPPVVAVRIRSIKVPWLKHKWQRTPGHSRAKATAPVFICKQGHSQQQASSQIRFLHPDGKVCASVRPKYSEGSGGPGWEDGKKTLFTWFPNREMQHY